MLEIAFVCIVREKKEKQVLGRENQMKRQIYAETKNDGARNKRREKERNKERD